MSPLRLAFVAVVLAACGGTHRPTEPVYATPPTTLAECTAGCEPLSDEVPGRTKCASPRARCQLSCQQRFPER